MIPVFPLLFQGTQYASIQEAKSDPSIEATPEVSQARLTLAPPVRPLTPESTSTNATVSSPSPSTGSPCYLSPEQMHSSTELSLTPPDLTPPRDQPSGLYRRHQIAPISPRQLNSPTRRSIFGAECKHQSTARGSLGEAQRQDSFALIRRLVRPPPNALYVKNKSYFVEVDPSKLSLTQQQPQRKEGIVRPTPEIAIQTPLPELPTPLRRFYADPNSQEEVIPWSPRMTKHLRGEYPILSHGPSSILRESSYRHLESPNNSNNASPSFSSFSASSSESNDERTTKIEPVRFIEPMEVTSKKASSETHNVDATVLPNGSSTSFSETDFVMEAELISEAGGASPGRSMGQIPRGRRQQQHRVQFDPRVTVTEYQDTVPRYWYSEAELQRIKFETLVVVRKYMFQHPYLVNLYNQPQFDPITTTYRRKALFSIPVLSHNYDDNEDKKGIDVETLGDESSEKYLEQKFVHSRLLLEAMKSQVKRILLVVRNQLIQDLLGRSLKSLFPGAQIVSTSTGERAMDILLQARQNQGQGKGQSNQPQVPFDVVIAEWRLHLGQQCLRSRHGTNHQHAQHSWDDRASEYVQQRLHSSDNEANTERGSTELPKVASLTDLAMQSDSSGIAETEKQQFRQLDATSPSYANSKRNGKIKTGLMSGADLFRQISVMENSKSGSSEKLLAVVMIGLATAIQTKKNKNAEIDAKPSCPPKRFNAEGRAMMEQGASLIWGLPPPPMDDQRRFEIVSLLLQKRAKQEKKASVT